MDKQRARQLYELADRLGRLDINSLSEEQRQQRNSMIAKLQEEVKIIKEFAPPGSSDSGNDGFSDDTLKRLAAQWYNGDEDPRVEQTLAAAGWEIGQDEGYDDTPGVFVVQAGDVNGNSYISWPAHELEQGVAEASWVNGKLRQPEDLVWKQTSLSYDEAVNKYGKEAVRREGKNRLGQEVIAVHVPLGGTRTPALNVAEGAEQMTPNWAKYVLDQIYNSNGAVTLTDLFDEGIPGLHDMFMDTAKQHGLDPEEDFEDVQHELTVELEDLIKGGNDLEEASQRVDSLVTDALRIMKGPEANDAVSALKTVLGDREYNSRRGHYNFYVKQILDMHSQQGVTETKKPSPKLTAVNIKKADTVSEEINTEAYERLQKVFAFKNYES